MNRRVFFAVSLFFIFTALLTGCSANKEQKKPLNRANTKTYSTLYAETADNLHTNGCVSCHKKTADVDRSLPVYVQRIEGHPEVKQVAVSACYNCHEAQKNYELYKKFYRRIHRAHWMSEIFYTKAKGRCASCHSVERNGVSGIKDYPLAGYRSGLSDKGISQNGKQAPGTQPQTQPTPGP
ncbi:hypothetical protein [Thermincola ferriacetica]